ncbi:hypothetical protein [Hansschlegelia sp. KR7-227]|uniref:hypothetical protein n=1 Tax=Hansschlegelia sp. KR7-227 TaxID=3400914 RepID=UPI003C10D27E
MPTTKPTPPVAQAAAQSLAPEAARDDLGMLPERADYLIEQIRSTAEGYLEELIDDLRRLPVEHRKAGGEALADGIKRGMGAAFVLLADAATREALAMMAKAALLPELNAGPPDNASPVVGPVVIDYDADPYSLPDAEEPAPAPLTGAEIHAQLEAQRRIDALKRRRPR